jgi:hypothetical protein
MKYEVTCGCGRNIGVGATQAGRKLDCPACGQPVQVPRLSTLRISAGEEAIPLNSVERVEQAVRQGKLPSNQVCPITGGNPDSIAVFRIHCEQTWKKEGDSLVESIFWRVLFGGWIGRMIADSRAAKPEVLGRNTAVDAPVRVSSSTLQSLSHQRNQREMHRILKAVPEYAAVLADFPKARVIFIQSV